MKPFLQECHANELRELAAYWHDKATEIEIRYGRSPVTVAFECCAEDLEIYVRLMTTADPNAVDVILGEKRKKQS